MQIIEEYSESSFNHLSYFWVGMTHLYTGRFNQAVDYFSILLEDDLRNSTLRGSFVSLGYEPIWS